MANRSHNPQLRHCKTIKKKHSHLPLWMSNQLNVCIFFLHWELPGGLFCQISGPRLCQNFSTFFYGKCYSLTSHEVGGFDICHCNCGSTPLQWYSGAGKATQKKRRANELDFLQLTQTKECVWWRADFVDLRTLKYWIFKSQAHQTTWKVSLN